LGDFSLQSISTCRNSGKHLYDLGGIYYDDICAAVSYMQLSEGTNQNEVKIRWKNTNYTVQGNPLDTIQSVQIWRNDELIQEVFTSNFTDTLECIDIISSPDYYRYSICVVDINNDMGQMQFHNVDWLGGPIEGIVIIEPEITPITGPAIITCLQNLGYYKPVYLAQNTSRYPLESTLDAVFVLLGIYPNNHVLGDAEAQVLKSYLEQGGNIYMEGGDTWYFDPQTVLHPMFSILPVGDGTSDLFALQGQTGTFTEGMSFGYIGENAWIDHIDPITPAFTIFSNYSPVYNCAVAYSSGIYTTIGASFELGGLVDSTPPSTKMDLVNKILEFFDVIVPVELVSFEANLNEKDVILKWTTATELNNEGFEIERSTDNFNFIRVGFVEGNGTTSESHNYSFTDNTLTIEGKYYYRLKQSDYDGTFEYSEVIEIDYKWLPVSFGLLQNYPNPFNPATKIKFTIPKISAMKGATQSQQVTLKIHDILGNEITTLLNEVKPAGRYEIEWNANEFPSGVYFYTISVGSFSSTKKMILLK
jgi:hypothetical protein